MPGHIFFQFAPRATAVLCKGCGICGERVVFRRDIAATRHAIPHMNAPLSLPFPYPGESTWDHPCDEYYRKLYEEEKKKKMTKDKAKHDKSKQQVI